MTILFPIILVVIAVGAIIPIRLSKRKGVKIIRWDYIYPFLGVPIWIALTGLNIGNTASLSNLVVEIFWILIVSVTVPWVRYLLTFIRTKKFYSYSHILTVFPLIAAIVIRLLMPTLPE